MPLGWTIETLVPQLIQFFSVVKRIPIQGYVKTEALGMINVRELCQVLRLLVKADLTVEKLT